MISYATDSAITTATHLACYMVIFGKSRTYLASCYLALLKLLITE